MLKGPKKLSENKKPQFKSHEPGAHVLSRILLYVLFIIIIIIVVVIRHELGLNRPIRALYVTV